MAETAGFEVGYKVDIQSDETSDISLKAPKQTEEGLQ